MEYGRIIKRGIDVTFRHKVLWIFGIAAAIFGGMAGGRGGGGQGVGYTFSPGTLPRFTIPQMPQQVPPFGPMMPRVPWESIVPIVLAILGILAVFGILWAIVGIIVRYTSFGALIGMVNQIEEVEQTTFQSGLRTGWGRLLPLFVINLIIGIVGMIFAVALIILLIIGGLFAAIPAVLLFGVSEGAGVVGILLGVIIGLGLILLLILLAVVFSAAVTIVRELAFRASVIENRGIFEALGVGITLLRTSLRETVLMWLLLALIRLALSILAIPLMLLGMAIILVPALFGGILTESPLIALLGAAPGIFLVLVVGLFIGGLVLVFYSAVWTLTFRELQFGDMRYQTV
jgi:hypothetical protein